MRNIMSLSLAALFGAMFMLVSCGGEAPKKSEPATTGQADAAAGGKAWSEIRVAIDTTYKPFTYKTPEGQPTGFDVDIASALCQQLNVTCTFIEQAWDGMIPGLTAKKYDAIISSMSITAERQKVVDFTGKYYNTPSCVITMTTGSINTDYAAYSGMNIGVLKGSTQESFAQALLAPSGANLLSYEGQDQVYLDIKSGRLDGTVADVLEVTGAFLNTPDGTGYGCTSPTLASYVEHFGEGIGIAVRKEDPDLRNMLDGAINKLRSNGEWQRISDKYFPGVDIWGG